MLRGLLVQQAPQEQQVLRALLVPQVLRALQGLGYPKRNLPGVHQ